MYKKTLQTTVISGLFLCASLAHSSNLTSTEFKVSTTIENSCSITVEDGSFGEIDYFSPTHRYNTHDHIRDIYAKTPISILCSPGTVFNFKGSPQNTVNSNGYMLQHTSSPKHYIVVNPYFDLSPKDSEPVYEKLFRGQRDRYVTASGLKEDWTMYWFAFNYLTNRFKEVPAPIHGNYALNMTLNLEY